MSGLEIVGIAYVGLMTVVAAALAVWKGRHVIGWSLGCLLFPPLLYVLWRKPATERAGKVVCPQCDRWTVAVERCEHCRHEIDYREFVE